MSKPEQSLPKGTMSILKSVQDGKDDFSTADADILCDMGFLEKESGDYTLTSQGQSYLDVT